jgi:hypothetical protein
MLTNRYIFSLVQLLWCSEAKKHTSNCHGFREAITKKARIGCMLCDRSVRVRWVYNRGVARREVTKTHLTHLRIVTASFITSRCGSAPHRVNDGMTSKWQECRDKDTCRGNLHAGIVEPLRQANGYFTECSICLRTSEQAPQVPAAGFSTQFVPLTIERRRHWTSDDVSWSRLLGTNDTQSFSVGVCTFARLLRPHLTRITW